jgi:hypothetical protein
MKQSSVHSARRTGITWLAVLVLTLLNTSNVNAKTPNQIQLTTDHQPYLEEFVLRQRANTTILDVLVANPFDHKLKDLILNGVKQDITLKVTVSRKKTYLLLIDFNHHVSTAAYRQTIFFDNLKKVFVIDYDGRLPAAETTSYQQALRLVSTFRGIPLLTRRQRRENGDYNARIRAEIKKTSLPFHLEYLFFFLSAWDRKTQTYIIDIPRPTEIPATSDAWR